MKHSRIAAALGFAILAVGIGPAAATGNSHHVYNGLNGTTTNHPVSLSSSGPVTLGLVTCPSVATTGAWHGGAGQIDLLTLGSSTWSGCTGLSLPGGFTVFQAAPLVFHSTGGSTSASTDVITGHVHASFNVHYTAAPQICAHRIAGTAAATFNETTQTLAVNQPAVPGGSLTYTNGDSCLGQVYSGMPAAFTATFPSGSTMINVQ